MTEYTETQSYTLDGTTENRSGETIRRADGVVDENNDKSPIFKYQCKNGAQIFYDDMVIDGNASGQAIPDPENQFAKCHGVQFKSEGTHGIDTVSLRNIESLAPIGDGINITRAQGGGTVKNIIIDLVEELQRAYNRSSITLSASCERFIMTNDGVTMKALEVEIEQGNFDPTHLFDFHITGGTYHRFDFNFDGASLLGAMPNVRLKDMHIFGAANFKNANYYLDECTVEISNPIELRGGHFQAVRSKLVGMSGIGNQLIESKEPGIGIRLVKCVIDAYTDEMQRFIYDDNNMLPGRMIDIENCHFKETTTPPLYFRQGTARLVGNQIDYDGDYAVTRGKPASGHAYPEATLVHQGNTHPDCDLWTASQTGTFTAQEIDL